MRVAGRKSMRRRSSKARVQARKTVWTIPLLEALEDRTLLSINLNGTPTWIEQGPGPIIGSQGVEVGDVTTRQDNFVVGAVEAIAPHPADSSVIFAGTVNG